MIDYINGQVAELTPTSATLDCHGVGYLLNISLNTYGALNGKQQAKLYVHESIREDAHVLFGFASKHERELFTHLISVSGVGPSTARLILSSVTSAELEAAIASENTALLQSAKGIGAKTAQRIIVDLKDKLKMSAAESATTLPNMVATQSQTGHEAVAALVTLGFAQPASQKIVSKILSESPSTSVEAVIKEALKRM